MGQFRKLDASGDTKHEWDPTKPDEVEVARAIFDAYRKEGLVAARMENDQAGEIITEFDPMAGVVLWMPQMQGG